MIKCFKVQWMLDENRPKIIQEGKAEDERKDRASQARSILCPLDQAIVRRWYER